MRSLDNKTQTSVAKKRQAGIHKDASLFFYRP